MSDLDVLQEAMAQLRVDGATALAEARAALVRAERLKAARAALARTGGGSRETKRRLAALDREIAALEGNARDGHSRGALVDGGVRERLGAFLNDGRGDGVEGLFARTPFLLFPVRLETKFRHGDDGLKLRVRLYPDTINISTHDPLLSEGERDAGLYYWAERQAALALPEETRRPREAAAWALLASRFGGPRARYVARQSKPSPWPPAGPLAAPAVPDPLDDDSNVRLSHSVAPPRARLLPDRFIVIGYDEAGKEVARAPGNPIPDTLMLGPDPEVFDAQLSRGPDGRLAADAKLLWMIDFNAALDVGMAVVLDVPEDLERKGFARLVAVGAKLSMDSYRAASALEDLLGDHRFTDGIDFLPNGSPTNNNDDAPSAFTTDLSADEALVAVEVEGLAPVRALDHGAKSDAQRLAEALGIAFETVADWPGAPDARNIADALAMNRALWPATIGRFLKELTGDAIAAPLKSALEKYGLTYVTGRTLLPNIRVGRQPYGVLATGNLAAWTEPREGQGREAGDLAEITGALAWFRRKFEGMGTPAQIGGGGDEALANSMRVIGQLASSVTYSARKGVTDEAAWNTLNYTNVIPMFALNWWNERVAARDASFADVPPAFKGSPFAKLVLLYEADTLMVPVVDRDPEVPLSETLRLSTFDDHRNYIDWLLSATTDELRSQAFKDADGVRVPAPRALLYRLLHDAWTQQLVSSSKDLFARLHGDLVAKALASSLVNVGEPVVPEAHAPMFDAAALGLVSNSRVLGDHLLDIAISGSPAHLADAPEALTLLSHRAALDHLSTLSTAALERLFAEHVDLASYRLDAWQSALASRRLDRMRRSEDGAAGIYLGAYGYVEGLRPKPKPATVRPDDIPESLRSDGVGEQFGNGGFVHAPSLGHAVTAAVLRNAYLTHTEPSIRAAMSVNLTSRRVRSAMALIEGIRNGQDLAALLGYQLERGFHENHPGVELDALIYALRARFPLVSRRLTPVPDGTPAERIEARNVIDGLSLVEQLQRNSDYPHGIPDLPDGETKEGKAVRAEFERLEDALDAVSDLTLAESVHQAVQSNIDRARGVVGAVGEGEVPPMPDVVVTPRSGHVFTQRVALHLPPAGPGWLSSPTPRALANPSLNAWLAAQLPPPAKIGFQVRRKGLAPFDVTLGASGLEPIDLVLMSGDRFGDGSSELERQIADRWCEANGIGDAFAILFKEPEAGLKDEQVLFDLASGSMTFPLIRMLPQLRALRRMIGAARGMHAQDYRLAEDADKANARNPKGFALDGSGDIADLPGRISAVRDALDLAATALQTRLDALKAPYEAVRADAASFDPTAWKAPLDDLRIQLRTTELFGLAEALPRSAHGTSVQAAFALYEQGVATAATIAKKLEAADAASAPLPLEPPLDDPAAEDRRQAGLLERRYENLLSAARQLLGSNIVLQPSFRIEPAATGELDAALGDPIEKDPLAIEAWLQSLARVRRPLGDVAANSSAAAWLTGSEPRLVPIQIPKRADDPWIGQAWVTPPGDGEILSVVAINPPASFGSLQHGLLIDEWTETVPGLSETTGLAFHFDRPGAAAPQALLLVTPSQSDGTWRKDELPAAILDTFARARLRALEPDHITASSLFPILPMTFSKFARHEPFATEALVQDVQMKFEVE